MVSLQEILANKQARGAFGQMRMETIVKDGLPKGAYTFQATLSNGKRPDCLLHMPNTKASVVIDAKFPLEGFEAFRTARREEEKKEAARRVRVDVARHVDAMTERYFIAGETQDTAILFVPSEAIYADLCEHFTDLVQRAHRSRIVICAPNMLMLAVQTMQAILKDVQMREQAHLIQREVTRLMDDMGRFRERVLDLQRHFGQANQDIEKILTSSDKIAQRGRKIETLEFEDGAQARWNRLCPRPQRRKGEREASASGTAGPRDSRPSPRRIATSAGRNLLLGRALVRRLHGARRNACLRASCRRDRGRRRRNSRRNIRPRDRRWPPPVSPETPATHRRPSGSLKLESVMVKADIALAVFVRPAFRVGRGDPEQRLVVVPAHHVLVLGLELEADERHQDRKILRRLEVADAEHEVIDSCDTHHAAPPSPREHACPLPIDHAKSIAYPGRPSTISPHSATFRGCRA
jgi:hypothetical protein